MKAIVLATALLLTGVMGCLAQDVITDDIVVLGATFAEALADNQEAIGPTSTFIPGQTIYLSVVVKGRANYGVMRSEWYVADQFIVSTQVDLSGVAGGEGAEDELNTIVGFNVKQTEPFPVRSDYRTDLYYDDVYIGSYTFAIVPGPDSIQSKIHYLTLASAVNEDFTPRTPANVFSPAQTVYISGVADTGIHSSLEVRWYVNGQLHEDATRVLSLVENVEDNSFAFSYLPDGGWPVGTHEAHFYFGDGRPHIMRFTVE